MIATYVCNDIKVNLILEVFQYYNDGSNVKDQCCIEWKMQF